jgi:hypothetical protein
VPFVVRFIPQAPAVNEKLPVLVKLTSLKKANSGRFEVQPSPFDKLRAGSAGLDFGRRDYHPGAKFGRPSGDGVWNWSSHTRSKALILAELTGRLKGLRKRVISRRVAALSG